MVFLDKFYRSEDCSYVTVNNRQAAFQAVDHLLQIGHRRIGIVTASVTASHSVKERIRRVSGSPCRPRAWKASRSCLHRASARSRKAVSKPPGSSCRHGNLPTALFCTNDVIAIGAMRAIFDAGLDIPRDISVVGFDDVPIAALLRVPLTTVAQPIQRMGASAVELLIQRIEGGASLPSRQIVLEAHLVVRQSTAAPRATSGET